MAKHDWDALHKNFLDEHGKSGVSPREWCASQGLNYSSAKRYIKVTNYNANSQKGNSKSIANSQERNRRKDKSGKTKRSERESHDTGISQDTKPGAKKRRVVTNYPPFSSGNQHALKHGGYARRMLLSDAVTEDAKLLTLEDELFWLRAANLTAAENIGRWKAEIEGLDADAAKDILALISAAEKAMHRNTVRIESIEHTRHNIRKMVAETEYKTVATEKVGMEIDAMAESSGDSAIVVHNSLPIPGR